MPRYLFCIPPKKERSEIDVSKEYSDLQEEYYKLIEFSSSSSPFKFIPDIIQNIGEKQEYPLRLTAFINHSISNIRNYPVNILLSHYSFNPITENHLELPDLEVFSFISNNLDDLFISSRFIRRLYKDNDWKTAILTTTNIPTTKLKTDENSIYSRQNILELYLPNPQKLRDLASIFSYDLNNLSWRTKCQ